jgi:hypothetical protein
MRSPAFLDRLAQRVRRHALAQFVDDPCALVARRAAAGRHGSRVAVAAPGVQIGAADAGLGYAQDDVAGFRVRHVVFGDLEGLAGPHEQDSAAFHDSPPVR